jgi:hypothetical protein
MKVLVVYNSVEPQSVAGAAMAKLLYSDVDLMDIMGVTTGAITTAIGLLSAVYGLILINYTVTTAATGVISPAQQILLDAKTARTVIKTGTASASSSTNTLTMATLGAIVDEYKGMWVKTTDHTGLNQLRQITANSATVLTLDSAWTVAIDNTTDFTISENEEDFAYVIGATSGSNKRAYCAWVHEKLFPLTPVPFFIDKLAGDKTTSDTITNAQGVLDEIYITKAVKYELRDLTDLTVLANWRKLIFGDREPDASDTRIIKDPDMAIYGRLYATWKLAVETAAALTITL